VAVKLRLMRMGKKKQPTYRVVAADVRSPRDGRFIEIVGFYDPRTDPSEIRIDNAKAVAWLAKGAQPTESVRKLLKISGALDELAAAVPPKAEKVDKRARSAAKAKAKKAPAKKTAAKKATAKKATAKKAAAKAGE
jgi:small subunit ribosomal protein S16